MLTINVSHHSVISVPRVNCIAEGMWGGTSFSLLFSPPGMEPGSLAIPQSLLGWVRVCVLTSVLGLSCPVIHLVFYLGLLSGL